LGLLHHGQTDILYDSWSPAMTVSSICISILSMLSSSKVKVHTLTYVGDCCAIFDANGEFVLACEILTLLRTSLETKRTVSLVNDWGLLMKVVGFG
jgi:hypothetical protein